MQLDKIHHLQAKDLTDHFDLEDHNLQYLDDEQSATELFEILLSNNQYIDAVKLLSHALPNREAVWWACICAKQHVKENSDELSFQSLCAAEKWVYDPSEKNRRITEYFAEKGKYETAAAWLSAAAFWSGDSIVAENEPKVAPAKYLYAHAVAGSILMSVSSEENDDFDDVFKKYLEHGINIASGGNG